MCTFQTLYYHNDHGYVVKCGECNNIQVGFGNVLLTMSAATFSDFSNWLRNMEEGVDPQRYAHTPEAHIKSVTVPTPCEGLKLLFSPAELYIFNRMLDAADTELQSQAILELFNTGK